MAIQIQGLRTTLYNGLCRLARADIAFFLLPSLMILLVVGTVAQKYIGLYAAQKMFFSSFIFWWGFVPLPGGYLLTGLLCLFVGLKFILKSKWSFRKSGVILSHFGTLIFLVGGLVTALSARESFLFLPEGEQSPYIYDYTEKEMLVYKDNLLSLQVPFGDIQDGFSLTVDGVQLTVQERYENIEILKRTDTSGTDNSSPAHGMAQFMDLTQKPSAKNTEENLAGIEFTLSPSETSEDKGSEPEYTGRYVAFDAMPKPVEWQDGGHDYILTFGKVQRELPFAVKLVDFKEDKYPGEDMARRFHSDVVILDGEAQWPVRIEMNKPLRYKGYTFYQSSFQRDENGREYTILSVVENRGRLIPYIGTLVLGLGLLIHSIRKWRERIR